MPAKYPLQFTAGSCPRSARFNPDFNGNLKCVVKGLKLTEGRKAAELFSDSGLVARICLCRCLISQLASGADK